MSKKTLAFKNQNINFNIIRKLINRNKNLKSVYTIKIPGCDYPALDSPFERRTHLCFVYQY